MMDYHYTECGLDNVWLANGFAVKETPYGTGVSVECADELHELLGLDLVSKKGPLTGKEFRFLRTLLGLSQSSVAEMHGVSEQTVSLWERGRPLPQANDRLIRICFTAHVQGDTKLAIMMRRLNHIDRTAHNMKIVARSGRHGWKSTVEVVSQFRQYVTGPVPVYELAGARVAPISPKFSGPIPAAISSDA
jgi:DNA-binding transcriptional regulator YiaG